MEPASNCASQAKRVILEDFFDVYGKNSSLYVLLVESYGLLYCKAKLKEIPPFQKDENNFIDIGSCRQFQHLSWRDMIGCQCMKAQVNLKNSIKNESHEGKQNSEENGETIHRNDATDNRTSDRAYLCVYAYPLTKKRFGRGVKRQRMSLTLAISRHGTFQDNLALAEKWRDSIRTCITGGWPNAALPSKKHLLVLVNPHSGPGKALSIFKQRIAPVLAEASVTFDLIVTERQNHAYNLIKEAELNKWHGIVIVAGDGLIYEVINGLMSRADWSTAIKTPIGVVPGGSGNGLAAAINHALGESLNTNQQLLSAFNLAKGRIIPMDLVRVHLANSTILYSFLCVTWGLIADIDIESERLRSIGDTRFVLWSIPRIANLRLYRGKVSYLPASGYQPSNSNSSSKANSKSPRPNTVNVLSRSTSSYEHAAKSKRAAGMRNANSVNSLLNIGDDDEDERISHHQYLVRVNSVDPPLTDDAIRDDSDENEELDESSEKVVSLLEPLDRPVPPNWTQIEDDFVLVCVAYQTHIGSNVLLIPNAALDDGLMWLMMIRKGVSRSQLLQFLLALDSGGHLDYSWVELIPIRAFRLEPITENGHLTVDGELIEYGPVQAEVLPSVARILTH